MTFVLSVQTAGSIWLVADRRLSGAGIAPIDDAVKIANLETTDGVAILGYAGLGATAIGSQPSHWVSNVLRGRNLQLEPSLCLIADAMRREFATHLSTLKDVELRRHSFLVPAFNDGRHKLYAIQLRYTDGAYHAHLTRGIMDGPQLAMQITIPFAATGSGVSALRALRNWQRPILHLLKAYHKGRISAAAVADRLAEVAFKVHQSTLDGTVGPRSIVIWRNAQSGIHKGGGAQRCYDGTSHDYPCPGLPTIGRGMDIGAIASMLMREMAPHFEKWAMAVEADPEAEMQEVDAENIKAGLAGLPSGPDEKLR